MSTDATQNPPLTAQQHGQPCRVCGAENVPLHFDSVAPPEHVGALVVRDRGRCIDCVVHGK
jgi:hypothetical protein